MPGKQKGRRVAPFVDAENGLNYAASSTLGSRST